MLLQTNSYIVPKDRRAEHARLMRRFRQVLAKLGCDNFEVYEQVGANWSGGSADTNGRFVQIMRFRDRKHQLSIQNAERSDPAAQSLINEFCELVNFQYQQQQGFFAVGFYNSVLPTAPARSRLNEGEAEASAPVPVGEAESHVVEEATESGEQPEIVQEQGEIELPPPEHQALMTEPPMEGTESHSSTASETPHDDVHFDHHEAHATDAPVHHEHPLLEPEQVVDTEPPLDLEGSSNTSGENVAEIPTAEGTSEVELEPLSEEELLTEISDGAPAAEHGESTEPTESTEESTIDAEVEPTADAEQNGDSVAEAGQNGESQEPPPAEEVRRRSSLFRRSPRNRG
jgi:hypothetical protein